MLFIHNNRYFPLTYLFTDLRYFTSLTLLFFFRFHEIVRDIGLFQAKTIMKFFNVDVGVRFRQKTRHASCSLPTEFH